MAVEPATTAVLSRLGADIAKKAAENVATQFGRKITGLTRSATNKIAVSLRLGVQPYLETSYTRCRFFKTILSADRLEVTKHYVHVKLTCDTEVISDDKLVVGTDVQKSIVITGLAGSGKSMLMKYLTVWHFENTRDMTPLFVELRHLNNLSDRNLLTYIRTACTSRVSVISETHFDAALKAGVFLLILDGFDELNHDIRQTIEKQILDLRKDFPNTGVIISSRPDEQRFGSWTEFRVFKVNELDKDQTVKLVNSLPYDAGVKKRFLTDVVDKLYETHQSFLSSPLLSTIMLLTFESFAEIPTKIHAFYGQAFDTLFQRHDAQKDQFNRQTYSGLELEDFKTCFAAFCAMSYLQERLSFDEKTLTETADSAVKYIKQTRAKTKIAKPRKFTSKQFIDDLHETVCMLQHDGLEISFVHRSFQEYFAARFVTQLNSGKIAKIIDKYCRNQSDSVIPMLHDMYKEPVEIEWVIPTIDKIINTVFASGFELDVSSCFARFFPTLDFLYIGDDFLAFIPEIGDVELFCSVQMICRLYPSNLGPNFIIHMRGHDLYKNLLKLLEDPSNEEKPRFSELQTRLRHPSVVRGKSRNLPGYRSRWKVKLEPDDSWWLEKLGIGAMLRALQTQLIAIRKDIQGRDRRRNSILEDFI